jgi:hypothetical protein
MRNKTEKERVKRYEGNLKVFLCSAVHFAIYFLDLALGLFRSIVITVTEKKEENRQGLRSRYGILGKRKRKKNQKGMARERECSPSNLPFLLRA